MRIFGLIGERLGHSLSRELFEERFHREGLHDHHYRLFELDRVEQFTDLLRDYPDLVGLNVTIPYKRSVMPLLDAVDPLAAAVGAVNTIAIRDGRTTGYNTDVIGFREALPELIGEERPRALVLGGGGSSRAVSHVLRGLRIPHRVVSRSREHGDLTWDQLDRTVLGACPLLVNTTPLGMHPDTDSRPPLPYEHLGTQHLLFDLIYNPEETAFLRAGRERGARGVNGLGMLKAQAEAAWRIWNG